VNVNKARIAIGLLSVIALILAIVIQNEVVSFVVISICALASIIILYKHLPQLSNVSENNPKVKTLKGITIANIILVIALVILAVLVEKQIVVWTDEQASWILPAIFAVIIIGFGNVAPKVPHNRYTGLRLPWTVSDEETWIVAHRILGYISVPCGLLCFAGVGNLDRAALISVVMLFVWILVPGILSYIFYYKKWHPKK